MSTAVLSTPNAAIIHPGFRVILLLVKKIKISKPFEKSQKLQSWQTYQISSSQSAQDTMSDTKSLSSHTHILSLIRKDGCHGRHRKNPEIIRTLHKR